MKNKTTSFILILCLVLMNFVIISGCKKTKEGYITKGEKYLAQNKYNAAIIEFKNALNIDPNDCLVRLQLGAVYFQVDKLVNAEQELRRVIKKNANVGQPHFLLASIATSPFFIPCLFNSMTLVASCPLSFKYFPSLSGVFSSRKNFAISFILQGESHGLRVLNYCFCLIDYPTNFNHFFDGFPC